MSQERDRIVNALGGTRGLIDNGVPSIIFLILFNIKHELRSAIYAAIISSAILAVWRLIKRDTLQHAISGFIDRKSTRLNSIHSQQSRMPSSA